jgi:hypothetical protein
VEVTGAVCEEVNWTQIYQDRTGQVADCCENSSRCIKDREIL